MDTIFQTMNEAYIQKHYPNRSVFEAFTKSTKKAGIGVYLFFGAVLAGCLYGIVWTLGNIEEYRQSGETDMVQTGTVICIVFAVFALLAAFCIGLTIWRGKKNAGDWLKQSATHSKLSEAEIREFERQALMSDSYVLKLTSGLNAAVTGRKDGILTREFAYLADSSLTVLPIQNLLAACFVQSVYYIGDMQHRKAVPFLAFYLLSKNGVESFTEASPEAGAALAQLLLQRNPQIDTCGGRMMTTEEYVRYKKERIA